MTLASDVPRRLHPSVSASLWIEGPDVSPEAVTDIVGLRPTFGWRRGDTLATAPPQPNGVWGVQIGPRREIDLGAVVRELMALVGPYQAGLQEAIGRFECRPVVRCPVVLCSTLTPQVHLPRDVVEWMAALDAALDVDLIARGPLQEPEDDDQRRGSMISTTIEYHEYDPYRGMRLSWEPGFEISVRIDGGDGPHVVLKANPDGLISLARHLLTLAQPGVFSGNHLHLDEFNSLEPGSVEIIIERA